MSWLKRWMRQTNPPAEVLPPGPAPMRRTEITVDRMWLATRSQTVPDAEAAREGFQRKAGLKRPKKIK